MTGKASRALTLGVIGVVLGSLGTLPAAASERDPRWNGGTADGALIVEFSDRHRSPAATTARASTPTKFEYTRRAATVCGTLTPGATGQGSVCLDGSESVTRSLTCADGSTALDPLFRRAVVAPGEPLGPWEQVDAGGCVEDPDPVDPVVVTVEDFRRLPLSPVAPQVQPADGRALVGMGIAVHTSTTEQVLPTEVAGVPVLVRAVPVELVWDFGDGEQVTTTTGGAPWPDAAHVHPYPTPGQYEVRVTATWRGEFQVAGTGPWLPITGTATTTSTAVPVSVETAPARLVAEY